jgi:hypothetical protein
MFDLRQFIECLERREIIDIQRSEFIPYLLEHRVIELEEG